MKTKTIKAVIAKKVKQWLESIDDESVRNALKGNVFITGGCIASMLLKEKVNDFDLYFKNKNAAETAARYYISKFEIGGDLSLDVQDDRIRIVTASGHRGETRGDVEVLTDPGDIEGAFDEAEQMALDADAEKPADYRPVFMSTNAITLSGKIQLILRFFGEPEEIHKNYDFIHCTNYWKSWDGELVLNQAALESLLAKELRYVGSKYPVASIFRLRKFIARGWTINAGQILKAIMQINELDLTDPKILEDQLTGVDVSYFIDIINKMKERDPEKVNTAYLVEIIDRMF